LSGNKIALVVVPAAAAVAIGLVGLRLHFQPPTVPVFAITNGKDEVTLSPGDVYELEIRPESHVIGAIGARGFLLRENQVRPWDPPFSVQTDGSIRIAGPVNALFRDVPEGPWEVAVAVGRPEVLPTAPLDVLRGRDQNETEVGWRLVRERVRLVSSRTGAPGL
jgi:hypothetical protein